MGDMAVLEREMFTVGAAARLLQVPESTLRWWLDGGPRRKKVYPPVIRVEPTGSPSVTWGEFVEAGLLRQYRRVHEVKLGVLRAFIDKIREQFGVPYPLAHHQPYVGVGQTLVYDLQEEVGLDAGLCLVASANNQLVLTPAAEAFVTRVDWEDDLPAAWRPHSEPDSPVRMDPQRRFGRPSVKGVSTDVLWEQVDAGASYDEVAADFDLDVDDVRWAHAYEESVRLSTA